MNSIAMVQRARGMVEPEKERRSAVVGWIEESLVSTQPVRMSRLMVMLCIRFATGLLLRS